MQKLTVSDSDYGPAVAVTEDGKVVAWGGNDKGQCTVPTNLPPVKAVAAGSSHTAAGV